MSATSSHINTTPRTRLLPLKPDHAAFIFELVNTPGWLNFIGDRYVTNVQEAEKYIAKINADPNTTYFVIELASDSTAIGIVTLIKRPTLEFPDLGFALLPAYQGQGFAFEAASLFLNDFSKPTIHKTILALTKSKNKKSIRLIEKLGLSLSERLDTAGEEFLVYAREFD